MALSGHTAATYLLVPGLLGPLLLYLLQLGLGLPLGWLLLPGLALLRLRLQRARHEVTVAEEVRERYNVIVVGAGMSGLCAGARLAQARVPFTIFEAGKLLLLGFLLAWILRCTCHVSGEEVGGTWHHNTYPGCACDVWTTLYQFTFAQNPDWSRFVAPAAEIKRYLETFAAEHGLYPHIQFGTRVRSAAWRQDEAVWKVVTDKGGHAVVTRVIYQAALD